MFMLNTSKNEELTIVEKVDLSKACEYIDYEIPREIHVVQNHGLSRKKGSALALWHLLHRNTVFICADSSNMGRLLKKIDHELCHREQSIRYGWKYWILCLPVLRQMFLEPEAYDREHGIELMQRQKDLQISNDNWKRIKKEKDAKDKLSGKIV